MNKATELYYRAKSCQEQLQNLAKDFYNECIEEFEKLADAGCFSSIIYEENLPNEFCYDFEGYLKPLFKQNGFNISVYTGPTGGFLHDGWTISWNIIEDEKKRE